MNKTKEMEAQAELAARNRRKLVYVCDSSLKDGDEVAGIMFDRAKRFWLVMR